MFKYRVLVICLGVAVWSGCMTFNGAELPNRTFPDKVDARPVISTEVGEITLLLNGKDGLKPPMSAQGIGNRALSAVLLRWKADKLIADFGPPGDLKLPAHYKLRISGTQNEQGSIFGSIVTGATFFLFPSSSTLVWNWRFDLEGIHSGTTYTVETKNSMTNWMHLIFLPALPFSFVGAYRADSALSAYLYDELAEQGAWETPSYEGEEAPNAGETPLATRRSTAERNGGPWE